MTNKVKRSLIVFGLCLCFIPLAIFGIANIATKRTYASLAGEFNQLVQELEEPYHEGVYKEKLSNSGWASKVRTARDMYEKDMSDDDKGQIDSEMMAVWLVIMGEIESTLELNENLSQIYKKVNKDGTRVYASDKASFLVYREQYDALTASEKTFIGNDGFINYLDTAIAEAEGILDRAQDAVNAIDNIYRNGEEKIVLNSKESLNTAKDALDAVYGINIEDIVKEGEDVVAYITNYNTYLNAVKDYQAVLDIANAFVADVNSILEQESDEEGTEVCYSLQGQVDGAYAEYDALPAEEDNNLKGLNEVADAKYALDALQDRIDAVGAQIDDYIALVDEIGDVDYTEESVSKIEAAEVAYNELPNDVLEEAKVVAAKAVMDDARQTYDAMKAKVDDLIAQAENFPTAYEEGNLYSALNKFSAELYEDTTLMQQGAVKGHPEDDGNSDAYLYDTVFTMYQYYRAISDEQRAAANVVKTAINELVAAYPDGVEVTSQCNKDIAYVENLYENLEEEAKKFVSNYNLLDAMRKAFDEAMIVVEAWKEKVDLIEDYDNKEEVEDVATYFENIENAITVYNGLSDTVKDVIENDLEGGDYYTYYQKYSAAIAIKEGIEADIDVLLDAIAVLGDNTYPEITTDNLDALNEYLDDIDEAYGLYDSMTAAIKEYFANTEGEALAALNAGLENKAYIEAEIQLLPLLDAIAKIPAEIPDIDDAEALADYVSAVETANNIYTDVDFDDVREYFDENKPDALEALKAGLARNVVISVENYIAAIGDVSITSEDAINTARNAYDEMTEKQDEVRNYNVLEEAEATFEGIVAELRKWRDDVFALLGENTIDNLWEVNLETVSELEDRYDAFGDDDKAFSAVEEGREELDAIIEKSDERINNLIDRIAALPDELTDEDISVIEEIKSDYEKLHSTQKALVVNYSDFEVSYNKIMFVNAFEQAVAEIKAEVDAERFVFEDKIELYILKSVLNSASDELKGLISAKTKADLNKAITAFEAVDSEVVINVAGLKNFVDTKVQELNTAFGQINGNITELIESLNTVVEGYQTADEELQSNLDKAIEDLTKAYKDADNALKAKIEAEDGVLNTAINTAREALTTAYTQAINTLKGSMEAADKALNDKITKAIEDLTEADGELQEVIEQLNEDLAQVVVDYKAADKGLSDRITKAIEDLTKAYKDADDALKAEIEAENGVLNTAINAAREALTTAYTQAINTLKGTMEAADKGLSDRIDELSEALQTAIEGFNGDIDELSEALEAAIEAYQVADEELQNNLDNEINKVTNAYEAAIRALRTELNNNNASLNKALQETIKNITNSYTSAIASLRRDTETADSDLLATIEQAISDLTDAYTAADEEVKQALIDALNDVEASYKAADEAVRNSIAKEKADREAADNKINNTINDLQEQINALTSKTTIIIIVFAAICTVFGVCLVVLFVKVKRK